MKGVKDVLLFATADWDHPFWTNKQHMAVRLAEAGYRVLYVESLGLRAPKMETRDLSRIFRRVKSFLKGERAVRKNIWVFSPLVLPFHKFAVVRWFNRLLMTVMLKRITRTLNFKNFVVWTYNPMVFDLLEGLGPALVVYHSVDDLGSAPGLPSQEIRVSEKKMLQLADHVFVTSPELRKIYTEMGRGDVVYLPNVVDQDHFAKARSKAAEPADLEGIPHPRIGFVGAVSPYKFDVPLMTQLAELRPDLEFVLIGQVGEGQPGTDVTTLRRKNIHFMGPRRYDELPSYLGGCDAAILPSPLNGYTRSMFPMKFFEYLAAGVPVVATPLPALEDFRELFVQASTAEEFSAALSVVLRGQTPSLEKIDGVVAQHTWRARLEKMLRIIEGQA